MLLQLVLSPASTWLSDLEVIAHARTDDFKSIGVKIGHATSIGACFRDGRSIDATIQQLKSGKLRATDLPPMAVRYHAEKRCFKLVPF